MPAQIRSFTSWRAADGKVVSPMRRVRIVVPDGVAVGKQMAARPALAPASVDIAVLMFQGIGRPPALPRGHRHRSKSDKFIMGVRQPVRPYQTMTKCVVSALKCRRPVDGGREIANVCQPPIDLRTQAARCSTAPAPSRRRRRGLCACRWLCRAPADLRVSTPCLFATGDCRPQRSVSGSPTSSDLAPRHRRARRGDASKA